MDVNKLLEVVHGRPFCSFTLRMNDGREYGIRHPEWIYVTRRNVSIVLEADGSTVYLEPVLIASIHIPTPPEGATHNGPAPT
jgi:hypothetical protein